MRWVNRMLRDPSLGYKGATTHQVTANLFDVPLSWSTSLLTANLSFRTLPVDSFANP